MSLRDCIITLIIGIIAAWIAERIKPGIVLSPIKKVWSKLIKFVKIPFVHFIIIILLLIFLAKSLEVALPHYKAQKLVVALTNFHLVSGAETTDNNALISHLQDSLSVYKNDIELLKKVYPVVRDSLEACKLGEREGANIVVWGSIEKTSIEAEIIPHITIVRPLGKMKLEARQPEEVKISITELNNIDFKKRKAREITDVILFILGFAKYELDKYQEVIMVFDNIQNKNAEIFFYVGNCYLLQPKPDFIKAIDSYQRALTEDSNLVVPYSNWGVALANLGKDEEAIEKYKEATRLNPKDTEAHNNWGNALVRLGKHEEAIEKYKETVRLNPKYDKAYYNWGVALGNLGKNEEAIGKYKKAIRLNPNYGTAYYNWGIALGKLGNNEKAISKYKEAIRPNPNLAEAYGNLGVSLMKLGRKEEAKKEFLIALELFRKQGRSEDVKRVEELLKGLEGKRSTDRTD